MLVALPPDRTTLSPRNNPYNATRISSHVALLCCVCVCVRVCLGGGLPKIVQRRWKGASWYFPSGSGIMWAEGSVLAGVALFIALLAARIRRRRTPLLTDTAGGAVALVIAHPDDESMFFVPTISRIVQHRPVHLLCLSNGIVIYVNSAMSAEHERHAQEMRKGSGENAKRNSTKQRGFWVSRPPSPSSTMTTYAMAWIRLCAYACLIARRSSSRSVIRSGRSLMSPSMFFRFCPARTSPT